MRHNLALLLFAAALLVSPVGCLGRMPVFAVGGGRADDWSVPAPMQAPDTYSGVNLSLTPGILPPIPALGLYHYFDGDERLTGSYVSYNFGGLAWFGLVDEEGMVICPVVNPVVGFYDWSQSPEGGGLLTGIKVGVAVFIAQLDVGALYLTYDHGWFVAHGAAGIHDARFQTGTVAILLVVGLGVRPVYQEL